MNRPNRKLIGEAHMGKARIAKAVRYSRDRSLLAEINGAGDYVLHVPDSMSDEQAHRHAMIALGFPQVLHPTIRIEG